MADPTPEARGRSLRIMMVDSYLDWNSLERYMHRTAIGLSRRGCQVAVACRKRSQMAAKMEAAGIPHPAAAPRNVIDLWGIVRLAIALRRGGWDVAHAHYTRDYGPVTLAGKLARVPVVLTRHSIGCPSPRRARSMQRAARILVVSDAVREVLEQDAHIPSSFITTLHAGIDLAPLRPLEGPRRVLPEMGIDPDTPVFGMVNRVDETKGCDIFIRAAALLKRVHPEARFLLVGEGPQRENFQRLAGQLGIDRELRITGYVDDAIAVMRELTGFVAAGNREAFSAAILEAMACKIPAIVARSGGNTEAITDGETGLVFPLGDEKALAERMQEVIEMPARAAAIGEAARRRVEESFTLDVELDRLLQIYREVARR